jgi:hypothetical protein
MAKKGTRTLTLGKGTVVISGLKDKDFYELKYSNAVNKSKGDAMEADLYAAMNIRTGNYSLRSQIKNHKWVKAGRPSSHAIAWLYKTVFKNPKIYLFSKSLFDAGHLYMFEYFNPKYRDNLNVLPWFDQFPLVLGLGAKVTNLGVRNIGFNLHLLPPPIRIIVLCSVFEMYKRIYRYHIYYDMKKAIPINYFPIVQSLRKYGILFCVRMYIPARQRHKVKFPIKDWKSAIFIPSRGYTRIRANALIKEWKHYCSSNGINISASIDWKTVI